MPTTEERVRKAYNDRGGKVTQFHSRWVNWRTAKEAVREIGSYNYFDPEWVADAIDAIHAADPNAHFSVAREGSPAIYVQTGRPQAVIGVFGGMNGRLEKPDELDKVTGSRRRGLPSVTRGKSVIRAWWD